MPIYVYKFIETGETIEVQQAFTDEALTEVAHPSTGAVMKVKKVFTPIGVTFKGGGFYKTDSRPSGSSSGSSSTASTPASSESSPGSGGAGTSSSTAGSSGSGSAAGSGASSGSSSGTSSAS